MSKQEALLSHVVPENSRSALWGASNEGYVDEVCLTTLEASLKEGIFPTTKTARQSGQSFPEGCRAQRKEQAKNISMSYTHGHYQIYSGFADFLQVLSIAHLSRGL